MNDIINDFYDEPTTGRRWIPQFVTESHIYVRADFHGHISHGILKITDNTVGTKIVKMLSSGPEARAYLREHSDSLAQDYVPSKTRSLLAECDPCTESQEKAIKEDNIRRLQESRQKVFNFNNNIKEEEI